MTIACALSIAGSDSSGGAGIQADIKTMTALGVYAETAITALTAQNTQGVQGIVPVDPDFISQQLDSIFSDITPHAVKIGMLPNTHIIEAIAAVLHTWNVDNIVLDPVMVATAGALLAEQNTASALKHDLALFARVVTPNIFEAEVLSGRSIQTKDDMEDAARSLCEEGMQAVLVKGGHLAATADDVLAYRENDALHSMWFDGRRIETKNTHGTGCTLSSAIAAYLAKGASLIEAVGRAKAYVEGALAYDLHLGRGHGPLNHMWMQSEDE